MPNISDENRWKIVNELKAGLSQRSVATMFSISKGAVQRTWVRYQNTGNIIDLPKLGRPRMYSIRDERVLVRQSTINPKLTAAQLSMSWKRDSSASISTVKRILRRYGLFGRIAAKKPFLTKKQLRARLKWCRSYINCGQDFWNTVIYSDECRIELRSRRREYVRRPISTRYNSKFITKTCKYGVKSLMFWGCIKEDGTRMLIKCPDRLNSAEYINILNQGLKPIYEPHDVFQQDGASCHKARTTISFIEKEKICYLSDWPAQSPDLNIIENLWSQLKRRVILCKPNTIDELWVCCEREWQSITNERIKQLYRSIPRRLKEVIKQRGSNTSY